MTVPSPPRRVIIAGSRNFNDYATLERAIAESGWMFSEIVSGHARGVDQLGERYAAYHGIPLRVFPADWERYGRAAGHRRNQAMAHYADALLALWDGHSAGTKHMIEQMRGHHRKPTFVWRIDR